MPILARLAETFAGREFQRLGRHSLAVFAFGSLLGALGQAMLRIAAEHLSIGVGILGMSYTTLAAASLFFWLVGWNTLLLRRAANRRKFVAFLAEPVGIGWTSGASTLADRLDCPGRGDRFARHLRLPYRPRQGRGLIRRHASALRASSSKL